MTEQGSSTSSTSSASSNEDEVIAPPRELAPSRSTNPVMCQSQPVSGNPPRSRRCTPILLYPLQPSIVDQNTNLPPSDLYEPQSSRPVQELSHHAKKKTSKKISFQEPVGLRTIVEYPYDRYQESQDPGGERVWQRQKIRSKSVVVAPCLEPEDVSHRSRESINSIGSYGRKGGGKSRSHSISTIGSFHSQVDPVQIEDLIAMKTQIDELVSILMEKEAKLQELTSNSEDDRNGRVGVQIFSVLAISIGHILDGTVLAYPSPALPSMFETAMANNESSSIHPNPMEANFIRSIHSVGATLACLFAGFAMSFLGRRGATLYCTIPAYVCGYLLIGSAPSVWLIILGRFLTGIGLGLTLSVPTVYIVEITNLPVRGTLGVVPNLLCQIGIFATYVSGRWLDWSGLAFLACSVGLPFFLVVWNIPESPIYLIRQGRTEEATRVTTLLDLKTASLPVDCQLKQKLDGETHTILGSIKKLKNPQVWKPFLCGLGLMFFFQATAYPLLIGSTVELFREAHLAVDEHLATIIVGIVIVLNSIVAIPLARSYDRKSLLLVSGTGTASCLFVLGTFFYLKDLDMIEGYLTWMPIISFIVYIAFFMCGYGSVSWLVVAEVLPTSERSFVYPLAISGTWLFNFVFAHSYVPMTLAMSTAGIMWFYASLSFVGVAFVASCIPETRNQTAEQIAHFYTQGWIFCTDPNNNIKAKTDISEKSFEP